MRLQNKRSLLIVLFSLGPLQAFAQNDVSFRTPTKIYAGAYTVKMLLKKGDTDYDIPVWIKPDQAESTLDASFLKDLGYSDRELMFDDVTLSNEKIEKKTYKNMKSEWAFVPDFAKSCCYGVIGRDILNDFEIRFDPKPPAHLEWRRVISEESRPLKTKFLVELKDLFSLTRTSEVPVVLNLQEQTLEYEGARTKSPPSLFTFTFVPPDRYLKVQAVLPKEAAAAKKAGLKPGAIITVINGERVEQLDRWQIEKYLRGEKMSPVKFVTKDKKEFSFNFSSHHFE